MLSLVLLYENIYDIIRVIDMILEKDIGYRLQKQDTGQDTRNRNSERYTRCRIHKTQS